KSFEPLNNLGNIYFHQEKYNQALDYYSLSLLIEQESNNLSGQAYTQNNIGAAYFKLENYQKAEEHQLKALELALKIDGKPILKSIYKSLSETYYKQKRLEDAYQTLLKYDQAKDFVYNEESSRKLARLELAIELEEKEKEIEINQKENAINTLENKNNRSFIIIFMMGGILLMAFLFIVYSLRKDNKTTYLK
ncbi:MAG: tetratricopeptide repeat protein, partial [Cyclobacteriaceae bacterium]|nr:tetratricopeptide repeat protein [Cyclobacteriaceae bacterium]